jgi:adhesin transport system outer membrane protein
MTISRIIAFVVLAGGLSGCADTKPVPEATILEKAAELTVPEALKPADSAVSLKSYASALNQVSEKHPRVVALAAQSRRAAGALGERASAFKPQVGLTGRAGQYDDGTGWTNGATVGLDISQLIYDGGAAKAGMDAAQTAKIQADLTLVATREEVLNSAGAAWIDVWFLEERARRMKARLDEASPLINRIKKMAETGLADRTIIEKADKSVLDVRLEIQRLESSRSEAAGRFSAYFGTTPKNLTAPKSLVSSAEAQSAADNWRESAQLKASASRVLTANFELQLAEADLKPKIVANAGSTAPLSSDAPVKSIGLMVTYNFSDGGRRKSRIESAKASVAAAEADLELQMTQSEAAAFAANLSYADVTTGITLVKEQIAVLSQSRETARSQIASAQSNLNTLLETEIDLYRAEDRLLALESEKLKLELRMLQIGGKLAQAAGRE